MNSIKYRKICIFVPDSAELTIRDLYHHFRQQLEQHNIKLHITNRQEEVYNFVPDLLITQQFAIEPCADIALRLNIPFWTLIHSSGQGKRHPNASLYIYNSQHLMNSDKRFPDSKKMFLQPSIDFTTSTSAPAHTSDKKYITCIGSTGYNYLKGCDVVVELARLMPDQEFLYVGRIEDIRYDIHYQWIGKMSPLEPSTVRYDRHNLPSNLHTVKNTHDLTPIWSSTKLLIIPSIMESFGRVAVAAAVHNIPVIASDLPGLREATANLATYVTQYRNVEEWANTINSALKHTKNNSSQIVNIYHQLQQTSLEKIYNLLGCKFEPKLKNTSSDMLGILINNCYDERTAKLFFETLGRSDLTRVQLSIYNTNPAHLDIIEDFQTTHNNVHCNIIKDTYDSKQDLLHTELAKLPTPYVGYIDSDVLLHPSCLADLKKCCDTNPDAMIIGYKSPAATWTPNDRMGFFRRGRPVSPPPNKMVQLSYSGARSMDAAGIDCSQNFNIPIQNGKYVWIPGLDSDGGDIDKIVDAAFSEHDLDIYFQKNADLTAYNSNGWGKQSLITSLSQWRSYDVRQFRGTYIKATAAAPLISSEKSVESPEPNIQLEVRRKYVNQVTVILNVYNRPNVFREQLQALCEQTIQPYEIWICLLASPDESAFLKTITEYKSLLPLRVVTSDINFKYYGRFQLAMQVRTPYVCFYDDDIVPGPKNLQLYLDLVTQPEFEGAILGQSALLLHRAKRTRSTITTEWEFWPHHRATTYINRNTHRGQVILVDYLCGHSFTKVDNLRYIYAEGGVNYSTGENMRLCFMAHKYGKVSTYCVLPEDAAQSVALNEGGVAGSTQLPQLYSRSAMIKEYITNGYKLVKDRPESKTKLHSVSEYLAQPTQRETIMFSDDFYNIFEDKWSTIDRVDINHFNQVTQLTDAIGIVIPVYNRSEYFQLSLDSIARSNLENAILIFINDHSYDPGVQKCLDTIHSKVAMPYMPYMIIHRKENLHMYNNLSLGWNILRSLGCKYLTNLDSDAIVRPDWLSHLKDLNSKYNRSLITGFNTTKSNHINIAEGVDYYKKNNIGGINLFFSTLLLTELQQFLIDPMWDHKMCHYCVNKKIPILATRPSVVQHIGYYGLNATATDATYDFAYDFYLEQTINCHKYIYLPAIMPPNAKRSARNDWNAEEMVEIIDRLDRANVGTTRKGFYDNGIITELPKRLNEWTCCDIVDQPGTWIKFEDAKTIEDLAPYLPK